VAWREGFRGDVRTSLSEKRRAEAIMREEGVMHVHFEIPEEIAQELGSDAQALARTVLESVALEGVRSGKLTVTQARRLLGIASRFEMDGFLKAHGVVPDVTLDDVRRDSDAALAASP
jgi:hypothetical protein